ncbi:hypothetical protein ACFXPS_43765 [Nocardia sp. NPDC059091]|uniref:hypothetical protein n=1 Tax=unclassified Nocardia TaxID=2637762 RepID=UPI00368E7498
MFEAATPHFRNSQADTMWLGGPRAVADPLARGLGNNRHAVPSDAALLSYESLSAAGRLTYDKLATTYRSGFVLARIVEWLQSSGIRPDRTHQRCRGLVESTRFVRNKISAEK